MKATKPKIIALLVGIVVIATACLYLARFLMNFPAKASVDNLLSAGMDLFQKKQYQDARANLEQCYQQAPDGEVKNQALLFLSRCCTAQDDREKAIERWNKVIENPAMRSHHAEAFYSLAELPSATETAEQ